MRVIIQRVSEAKVTIAGEITGQIKKGLLVFVGFETTDNLKDIAWTIKKIANLRIFSDTAGKMNLSLKDVSGQILVVSQFTLHASTKKGNRPSFIKAANPTIAIPLYEKFIEQISNEIGTKVQTGKFGADMQISILNDGPVTIFIDSRAKE